MPESSSNGSSDPFANTLASRDGSLEIHMQGKQLDDRAAERWCAWARESVPAFIDSRSIPRRSSDGFTVAREVNFSTNMLGDHGVHQVLKMLYNLKIGVR